MPGLQQESKELYRPDSLLSHREYSPAPAPAVGPLRSLSAAGLLSPSLPPQAQDSGPNKQEWKSEPGTFPLLLISKHPGHSPPSPRGAQDLRCLVRAVAGQRQPQGGRLCALLFREEGPILRALTEELLVQVERRGGERASPSVGPGRFGSCSKPYKVKSSAHKCVTDSMVSQWSLF